MADNVKLLGVGLYTAPEAARLLGMPVNRVHRWLSGYRYHDRLHQLRMVDPLWKPQIPKVDGCLELGFRDLAELRFVNRFAAAGLSLRTIRLALRLGQDMVKDERPFSTLRFATDGRKIFVKLFEDNREQALIDVASRQYAFSHLIEPSLKDLAYEHGVAVRWWPLKGRKTVVIDPERAFGQPIVADFGVQTAALANAVHVEGSVAAAARVYQIPPAMVRDALRFEAQLAA